MDHFGPKRSVNLPAPSHTNTFATLRLRSGQTKLLVGAINGQMYSCLYVDGSLVLRQLHFANIARGSQIVCIAAFNRSQTKDDFCVGVLIQKKNSDRSGEAGSYLVLYTDPDPDRKDVDLNSLAQNGQLIRLDYRAHHLHATSIINTANSCYENVFLLSGDDLEVRMIRKDPLRNTYSETDSAEFFPEFRQIPDLILWIDTKYTEESQRRLTAYGRATGLVKFTLVNTRRTTCMMSFKKHFQTPIHMVLLFQTDEERNSAIPKIYDSPALVSNCLCKDIFNLLIVKLHGMSLFMDATSWMTPVMHFPKAEKFGPITYAMVADINRDGRMEILVGTAANELVVYTCKGVTDWIFDSYYEFKDPIKWIQ